MASFNKIILIGRVTAPPEMRYTPSGKPVTTFTLAVDRYRKSEGKDKEKEADFIPIVTWQKLAEICSQYLEKGKLIVIEGRLQIRSYTANDGGKRKVAEVIAENMQMLSRRGESGGADIPHDVASPPHSGGYDDAKEFDQVNASDLGLEDDVPF
jgi:single-strand DNA-binding protein